MSGYPSLKERFSHITHDSTIFLQTSDSLIVKLPFHEIQHALNMYGEHRAAVECINTQVAFLYISDVLFLVFNQHFGYPSLR